MSAEAFELTGPGLTPEDPLDLDDPHFEPNTVAVVTAAERRISEREALKDVILGQARTKEMMTPAEVANPFVFSFSRHGKHPKGGDLLWDGGYTTTYE
jgi:hypothetical protein